MQTFCYRNEIKKLKMSCILSMLSQIRVKEKPKSDIVSAWYKKRQISSSDYTI